VNFNKLILLLILTISFSVSAADNKTKTKSKVKFKASSRIDFESLLIEGERKKPEMAVVTGNIGEKDSGLLKFRADFTDVMADDLGESIE
jgi:hypothetical protein